MCVEVLSVAEGLGGTPSAFGRSLCEGERGTFRDRLSCEGEVF